jgi:hypothetical protein
VNPRRATTIVAGNTNGRTATTTGTDVLVEPGVELTMFPPNRPRNRTASHMVMIDSPAHSALARSQAADGCSRAGSSEDSTSGDTKDLLSLTA